MRTIRPAVAEAQRLGDRVRSRDRQGRTDFRRLTTVTIDGETARDFDDAITLEPLPAGNVRLGVHIADVSHYVAEGSALDQDARGRGASVYFPDRAVHMFPPALSTGLCSLRPRVDRLVQSCLMEIDGDGGVVRYEIHDGLIHSDARMTYAEVDALLSDAASPAGRKYADLAPFFDTVSALVAVLRERRRRRGAIDFDVPVARFRRDDEGRVEAIVATSGRRLTGSSRSSCWSPTRRWRSISRARRCRPCSASTSSRPRQGGSVRGVRDLARVQPLRRRPTRPRRATFNG